MRRDLEPKKGKRVPLGYQDPTSIGGSVLQSRVSCSLGERANDYEKKRDERPRFKREPDPVTDKKEGEQLQFPAIDPKP